MSKELKRFILKILIAAAVLAALGSLVFTFMVQGQNLPILPWMLVFFAAVTIATHVYQVRLARKNMVLFTRYSMFFPFFRLLVYSAFAIGYLAVNSDNAAVFVVCLVVVYVVFTFIEVSDLARIVRKNRE
ncbi:MAG TPA: hypothetical protein ENN90_04630 [Mariniphaga anaerophila]|uniref:ATP synthase I chain n=1 Tax=Mariniphaga anaerophila TaxID=1484053 RepID=A0A831LJT7_9BACT|nr:hypothetical protein [Mariniphaga anaerophila]